jgi:anti-sigma B factor antagonist
MQTFRLIERDLEDGQREVRIEGELDLAVAEQLQELLAGSDEELVVIDLATCEFIDSTGIAVIVQASRAAAEDGRRVVAHSPTAQVLRVLTLTGLTANGLVFTSLEEASSRVSSAKVLLDGDAS